VNCLTISSGCQCSIQLKQIIIHKIKANVPSKHWDKMHRHTVTDIMISFSLCKEISSIRQKDNKRHVTYWHSPSTLCEGGKSTHAHAQTHKALISELISQCKLSENTWIHSITNRLSCYFLTL
jgi:hypothetical protein